MNITEIPRKPGTKFKVPSRNYIYIIDDNLKICNFINNFPIEPSIDFLQRVDFEIVPVEPKVLSPEKIFDKVEHFKHHSGWLRADVEYAILESHKNGRLERDLELRELTEAATDIKSLYYPHVINDREAHAKAINKLLHVSKTLKPLNKDD